MVLCQVLDADNPRKEGKYPSGSYLKCQLKTGQCGINSLITFFNAVDNFDEVVSLKI
jgi:hypothetical protein